MSRLRSLLVLALVAGPAAALLPGCSGEESTAGAGAAAPTACSPEGVAEYCYPGPPTAGGIGECTRGTRTCAGGIWSECEGYGLPVDEVCGDFLDNNCDGSSDEGCSCETGAIQPCYTGPATTDSIGMCADGAQACIDSVWDSECVGQVLPAPDEPCNEVDDNCNGVVDDGCSCTEGATRDCYGGSPSTEHIGECHGGTQSCVGGLWDVTCAGEVVPGPELCNGRDDDCDGIDDDGLGETTCGLGPCEHTVQNCVNGTPQACDPMAGSTTETCDGADNDCDDQVDEGCSCVNGSTQACYTGTAGTQNNPPCHSGTQTCADGAWGACSGQVTPSTETCNNVDDDCDGTADDGLGSTNCGVGPCAHSQPNCVNGVPQACNPYQGATSESCNNVDDNCNGTVDDGLGTTFCGVGQCYHGQSNCVGGVTQTCNPMQGSSTEVCDNVDNDCDNSTDEGNPGGGGGCSTGQAGICAAGTYYCQSGSLNCVRNQNPTTEICNNQDDNCNGSTDENNPGGGGGCSTGQPGICAAGTLYCQSGSLNCVRNQNPTGETCNNQDDDCNGSTDEGNPGGGASCNTGQPGVCADGTVYCQSGSLSCLRNQEPYGEVCDGIDNNCDGGVDENPSTLCDEYSGYFCYGSQGCVWNGTCPFLYSWNGSDFAFEADMYGSGKLGVAHQYGYLRPHPDDYYVLAHEPVALGGSLELRLVEERSETNYFDFAELLVVDVPQDLELYTELHTVGSSYVSLADALHTVSEVTLPLAAATRVSTGASVLAELEASDESFAVLGDDRNLFSYQTLELDLGELAGAPQVKLVIDARTVFPNSPAGIDRKKLFGPPSKLEVLDAGGQWVAVPPTVAAIYPPKEVKRPFVLDLTNAFVSSNYRVRFTFLFKTYLDSISVDTTLDAPASAAPLALESADLHFYGHSQRVGGELFEFIYGAADQDISPAFPGFYTRYGDVTPLLTDLDDKFAIYWSGDEVTLRFTPPAAPAAGTKRRFVLRTNGYYKDSTSACAHTVEPLPFEAMSNYPYDLLVEHYPNDAEHTAYRQSFNTRWLP